MKQSIYLAYKFIAFHRIRSLVLIFSIGIIIFLPNGLKRLINESELQMMKRARSTPLIVGSKGSMTDLVINALYFQQEQTEHVTMQLIESVNATGFGYGIPMLSMFSARSFPIVGTDPDYFNFRGLELEEGNWMGFVGECVIGSAVAEKLGLAVGDSLVSSPENFFDLAGVYPLKMNIVGVLQASDSPDDRAVFVDIKTNWVIMGLGHGHDDLSENYDPTVILERDSNVVKAGAKLYMYNTINAENIDSFHFHGDMSGYPLSSIIFIPDNQKSETLFRGRFAMGEFEEQVLVPEEVVDNLLQSIFRIRYIFNTVFILVGISTILILALIVALSVRLRKNEILTMFMIGSSRLKVAEILTFELILLTAGSGILAFIMYVCSGLFVNEFIQSFII